MSRRTRAQAREAQRIAELREERAARLLLLFQGVSLLIGAAAGMYAWALLTL